MHQQINIRNGSELVSVDIDIADLLQECWIIGLKTEFSCAGFPDGNPDNDGCDCGDFAYIAFPYGGDAKRFFNIVWNLGLSGQLERWRLSGGIVRWDANHTHCILESLLREIP